MGIVVESDGKSYRFMVLGNTKFWIDENNIAVSDSLYETLTELAKADGFDPDVFFQVKNDKPAAKSGVKLKNKNRKGSVMTGVTLASLSNQEKMEQN